MNCLSASGKRRGLLALAGSLAERVRFNPAVQTTAIQVNAAAFPDND
jgi:hypothetical protein